VSTRFLDRTNRTLRNLTLGTFLPIDVQFLKQGYQWMPGAVLRHVVLVLMVRSLG
jgi:hypothetical protein